MDNANYLPNDLMSLILNMRTESMKKDLDKQIEEWKEINEEDMISLTNEIHFYFIEHNTIFNHNGEIEEEAKLFSPYRVLQDLRSEREERLQLRINGEIEEDFGNYY